MRQSKRDVWTPRNTLTPYSTEHRHINTCTPSMLLWRSRLRRPLIDILRRDANTRNTLFWGIACCNFLLFRVFYCFTKKPTGVQIRFECGHVASSFSYSPMPDLSVSPSLPPVRMYLTVATLPHIRYLVVVGGGKRISKEWENVHKRRDNVVGIYIASNKG